MAIILEGPDASGKTSLAKSLLAMEPSLRFYSSGGAPKTKTQMDMFCAEQTMLSGNLGQILDRITPISHPIYNQISAEDAEYLNYTLNKILLQPRLVIVYCRPSNDMLMMPEKHQWKDYDTEEDKQKILTRQHEFIEAYDAVFEGIPHVHFDYSEYAANEELVPLIASSQISLDAYNQLMRNVHESKRCRVS